ncbi:hypothetical protein [Microcystis sp. LE19-195.1E]|uniref:hypothetical protein n=1 Tax=Microcystis sp. LE19-195.1E TaxID=3016440 RepID=UPI00258E1B82|nr:hypothetical protein [Microcystis sp. LE19-195.1E]
MIGKFPPLPQFPTYPLPHLPTSPLPHLPTSHTPYSCLLSPVSCLLNSAVLFPLMNIDRTIQEAIGI